MICSRCVKLVKDNENESNSQLRIVSSAISIGCVKLVKDNENESNSQLIVSPRNGKIGCVKLVKDNENESNSQLCSCDTDRQTSLCEAGQR